MKTLEKVVLSMWFPICWMVWCLGWIAYNITQANWWYTSFWVAVLGLWGFSLYLNIKIKELKEGNK